MSNTEPLPQETVTHSTGIDISNPERAAMLDDEQERSMWKPGEPTSYTEEGIGALAVETAATDESSETKPPETQEQVEQTVDDEPVAMPEYIRVQMEARKERNKAKRPRY